MGKIKTVLIVDDNTRLRSLTDLVLQRAGYSTLQAENGAAAFVIFCTASVDAVVTDLHMPVLNGRELLRRLKNKNPATPVIIMTAENNEEQALELVKEGACRVIEKLTFPEELLSALAVLQKTASETPL